MKTTRNGFFAALLVIAGVFSSIIGASAQTTADSKGTEVSAPTPYEHIAVYPTASVQYEGEEPGERKLKMVIIEKTAYIISEYRNLNGTCFTTDLGIQARVWRKADSISNLALPQALIGDNYVFMADLSTIAKDITKTTGTTSWSSSRRDHRGRSIEVDTLFSKKNILFLTRHQADSMATEATKRSAKPRVVIKGGSVYVSSEYPLERVDFRGPNSGITMNGPKQLAQPLSKDIVYGKYLYSFDMKKGGYLVNAASSDPNCDQDQIQVSASWTDGTLFSEWHHRSFCGCGDNAPIYIQ